MHMRPLTQRVPRAGLAGWPHTAAPRQACAPRAPTFAAGKSICALLVSGAAEDVR